MATLFNFIITVIKIVIISVLTIFYYPLNMAFLWLQSHYFKWKTTDRISFYIATPLYYLLFLITFILSVPIETMGEAFHPPLPGFR